MNLNIHPTPSVALGAYEVTPIEMAGAYTVFANEGVYVKPNWISMVRARNNDDDLSTYKPESHPVLDPRVAYMMVEPARGGHAHGHRRRHAGRGFRVPAAGKTGTSHDGWFAGFTSELLCIVWVGFDDNRELDLEGAQIGAADLDRVHETGARVQGVSQHQAVRGARRHRHGGDRSAQRAARHGRLPHAHARRSSSPARSRSIAAICTAVDSPV